MLRPLLTYTVVLLTALALMPDAEADGQNVQGSDPVTAQPFTLEVAPGKFVSGAQSSCTDLVEAKALKSVAKTSVAPQGFVLPSLVLTLPSSEKLNVDSIRAVVSDSRGHRAILELPTVDVGDLLASVTAVVQGPAKVISNDPARNADTTYVPCGLNFGGINWIDSSREMKVIVTVVGSFELANGDLTPVEVSTETVVLP